MKTISGFDRIGEENAFAVLARAGALADQGMDVINLGIGQQTPPVASVLITACSVAKADIWEVSKVNVYYVGVIFIILASGLLLFYAFNPIEQSFFIPCPFHYLTGLHCPGCGSQRALHQLVHFNMYEAFRYNPLLVLSLPILIYSVGI